MAAVPAIAEPNRARRLRRLRPPAEPARLVASPADSALLAVCYLRQSTNEQRRNNVWSLEAQYDLRRLALEHGYPEDRVVVIDDDLGISGTKGPGDRPGLARMIELIETGQVGAVYVIHISRISRDQTLIGGIEFGELCRRNRVSIVMPHMALDLRDGMSMRIYRMEIERAAEEVELLKLRLGGPKRMKARSGRFDGRSVPPGYVVDHDPESPTFERYILYPPHAEVVRRLFATVLAEGGIKAATRRLHEAGVEFPDFEAGMPARDITRSSLVRRRSLHRGAGGFALTMSLVRSIVTNPAYIGWWVVEGQLAHERNHAPVVDEDAFWSVQRLLADREGRGHANEPRTPQMLTGLLYCASHAAPLPMAGSTGGKGSYRCDRDIATGSASGCCCMVACRVLDDPIADLVLGQMGFVEYAESIVASIEAGREAAGADRRRRRQERRRLEDEIATLKANLAHVRGPEQVGWIWEEIEKRRERMAAIAAEDSQAGQGPTDELLASIRSMLAGLRKDWDQDEARDRNALMRLLLRRVDVSVDRDFVLATVLMASGESVSLRIERPATARASKRTWTDAENGWLRRHYPTSTAEELEARFPDRTFTGIRKQARLLGLSPSVHRYTASGPWTPEEEDVLRRHAEGEVGDAQLGSLLPGRTPDAIVSRRRKLGLVGARRRIAYTVLEPTLEMPKTGTRSPAAGAASPGCRGGTRAARPGTERRGGRG